MPVIFSHGIPGVSAFVAGLVLIRCLADDLDRLDQCPDQLTVIIQIGPCAYSGRTPGPFAKRPTSAAAKRDHPAADCTSASSITCLRRYRLRLPGVRMSTFRPPNKADSCRSIPARSKSVGIRSGLNTTSTSTSLSGRKSSRSAEPKMASRPIPCFRRRLQALLWKTRYGLSLSNLQHLQALDASVVHDLDRNLPVLPALLQGDRNPAAVGFDPPVNAERDGGHLELPVPGLACRH